jgi:hypothetical protein
MLNYEVKIKSVKDLMELNSIAKRYNVSGRINQNDFHGDIKALFSNLLYLPLNEASVEIDTYMDSQVGYITDAMKSLAA